MDIPNFFVGKKIWPISINILGWLNLLGNMENNPYTQKIEIVKKTPPTTLCK